MTKLKNPPALPIGESPETFRKIAARASIRETEWRDFYEQLAEFYEQDIAVSAITELCHADGYGEGFDNGFDKALECVKDAAGTTNNATPHTS